MAILDYISSLLDQLGVKHTHEDKRILTRWDTQNFNDLKISISTNKDESWIYFYAPFSSFRDFSKSQQSTLAVEMLKASWKVDGVQFAIDDHNDIMVLAETNNTTLSTQEADTLLRNVLRGCELLYDMRT